MQNPALLLLAFISGVSPCEASKTRLSSEKLGNREQQDNVLSFQPITVAVVQLNALIARANP